MSRKRAIINPVCGNRLKTLCDKENTSQKDLAARIHISPQTISKIVSGKCNLTKENAKLVVDLFGNKYRLEWLLGLDDYMTIADLNRSIIMQSYSTAELLAQGFQSFATLSGYTITPPNFSNNNAEMIVNEIKRGYKINKEDKTISISLEDMNKLQNDICDYV